MTDSLFIRIDGPHCIIGYAPHTAAEIPIIATMTFPDLIPADITSYWEQLIAANPETSWRQANKMIFDKWENTILANKKKTDRTAAFRNLFLDALIHPNEPAEPVPNTRYQGYVVPNFGQAILDVYRSNRSEDQTFFCRIICLPEYWEGIKSALERTIYKTVDIDPLPLEKEEAQAVREAVTEWFRNRRPPSHALI